MNEAATEMSDKRKMLDENEQLHVALENALEDNVALTEDRDRLLRRVGELAREVQLTRASFVRQEQEQDQEEAGVGDAARLVRYSQTEEELRVAFEELQVLTEELEVANTSLHETNQELDSRVEERTRQIREVNAALRSSEASFHTISDLVPELLWRADRRGELTWFNQRWYDYTGEIGDGSLGYGWLDIVHPAERTQLQTAWDSAINSGQPFEAELRLKGANGGYRWFLMRAEALSDHSGRLLHWFGAATNIQDQRAILEALQQSELRFRTLIEGMPQLVWRAAYSGEWTWSSPQWCTYTGQSQEVAQGSGWLRAIHPDDRESASAAWTTAQDAGSLEIEGRIYHAAENRYRHFRTRALPVRNDRNIVEWLGTSTDVDDILQLQEQQSVLVGELQHRTRNLMAVVQAVMMRTLKGAETLEDFRKCIDDRLQALARVQGLLSRREGGLRVPFDALVREELSAHVELDAAGNGAQVSTHGPTGVPLRSATIQTLALALHELATNAVKYGALSRPAGRLVIEWGLRSADNGEQLLWVDWRESGVADMPSINANPRGGGYGRELIERALPYQLGARTSYVFESDGVHCTLELSVPPEDVPMETIDG